jgi:hypothetical protein
MFHFISSVSLMNRLNKTRVNNVCITLLYLLFAKDKIYKIYSSITIFMFVFSILTIFNINISTWFARICVIYHKSQRLLHMPTISCILKSVPKDNLLCFDMPTLTKMKTLWIYFYKIFYKYFLTLKD